MFFKQGRIKCYIVYAKQWVQKIAVNIVIELVLYKNCKYEMWILAVKFDLLAMFIV